MRGRRSHKTATEKAKQEEFFERAEYVLFGNVGNRDFYGWLQTQVASVARVLSSSL